MKPFLLLATRGVDLVADEEYAAMLRYSGLEERQLRRVRMEQGPVGEIRLDDWSGIILGGGPYTVSDVVKSPVQERVEAELDALLDEVVARDFPFLGACYGIGTLGRHEGAVIDGTYAEPVGPMTVTLTAAGRTDQLFGELPETFEVLLGHKEAVRELPAHATALASSATCPVQAFRVGANVYATQFHPELDVPGIQTRIDVYKHAGYFAPDEADRLKARARSCRVEHPPLVLRRFVERFGTGGSPVQSSATRSRPA